MIISNICGNLGKDAKVREIDGTSVANFSVASSYYDSKDKEKKTQWVNCSLWGRNGLHQYLVKGKKVFVSGEMTLQSYTSKSTGEPTASLNLNVQHVELPSNKGESSSEGEDLPGWDD